MFVENIIASPGIWTRHTGVPETEGSIALLPSTSGHQETGGSVLAALQGEIFESFNMAQLWKLPVVFVCENNNYGMGTSTWRSSSNTKNYTRGDYLPGIWVDGQDVLAVRSATEFAIGYAQQCGPLVLELCTYRYAGHSMSDPGTNYRSREEVQEVRRRQDAIQRFRKLCLEQKLLPEKELLAIELDVRREMVLAVKAAKGDAELPLSHLWSDVYAEKEILGKLRGVLGQDLSHVRTTKGRRQEHKSSAYDRATNYAAQ
ncbi:probable pyruvate dehydrogenase E1 component subunit alpha, mitochondrial [Drosophila innubila]|uniref:probable pyruvate dehydrogenase E1 component subunit alpha, mitochondrial n=1 Tax=Drosophila innubila TaxID=198719 RepID=UPI00148E7345|nr:probable pyruvate dehydrogenase E1 component subunit alpha, mitochondrial [Drosophila innubila]